MTFIRKLKVHVLGFISFLIIIFCFFLSVFAYFFIPDKSENANQMHLPIYFKPPLFSVHILVMPASNKSKENTFKRWFFGTKNSTQQTPILEYFTEGEKINYKELSTNIWKSISTSDGFIKKKTFLLGTDKYGRDVLSRLILGMRISLSIGLVAVFISLLVGVTMGAFAGYYGGILDRVIVWLLNVSWSIPTLLLVIAISLALGKGYWQVFIAVGLTMWVEVARVVRGQVMSIKERQFISAAKTLGYSSSRIIFRHILPHIVGSLVVISSANFATAILLESGLSFLGVGLQPPTPGWGTMIKDNYGYIAMGKSYLVIIPGLAIMTMVMAFIFFGNAVQKINELK